MTNLLKSKKGQAQNYFAAIIFVFVFAFISIFGYLIFDNFKTGLTSANLVNDASSQKAMDGFTKGMNTFDYVIPLIMIVLIAGIAITSYKLASPPIFFIVTFIMAAFIGFVSAFFNYMFAQIVTQSIFTSVYVHFPLTILICTNFHWIALILIAVGSITLYGKKDQGQYA